VQLIVSLPWSPCWPGSCGVGASFDALDEATGFGLVRVLSDACSTFDRRIPRYPEALAIVRELEDTVADQDEQLGPDDPRTVASRLRLVDAYADLENAGDDRDMDARTAVELTKAVDSRIRTLGSDHPDTLSVRYDLNLLRLRQAVTHRLDRQDELETEFRSIADASARTLGHAHPMTLRAWGRLSVVCSEPERSVLGARVVRGWEELLAEQEQRLGTDDPQTLETMGRLVAMYRDDRGDEAQRLAERMTAGWGRVAAALSRDLGPVHADTAAARERHCAT
jgi:hypothetical protein